jgi:hypothetical protein
LTYHCLFLRDRRGRFGRSYRCSSFGGRCTYIHHLFQRMLLSCSVWSAYGSLIACASWIERLYVWEARFLRLPCICSCFSLESWEGCRAGSGSVRPCMHDPSGRCLVRIASMESLPDLTCAVRGAWVPWIPSAQAAVFPCTIAAPRHRTLRYPTLTGPTGPCLPACPCTTPIILCVSLT